jgi:hypothetical protein
MGTSETGHDLALSAALIVPPEKLLKPWLAP